MRLFTCLPKGKGKRDEPGTGNGNGNGNGTDWICSCYLPPNRGNYQKVQKCATLLILTLCCSLGPGHQIGARSLKLQTLLRGVVHSPFPGASFPLSTPETHRIVFRKAHLSSPNSGCHHDHRHHRASLPSHWANLWSTSIPTPTTRSEMQTRRLMRWGGLPFPYTPCI